MLVNIAVAAVMILATTGIHAGGMTLALRVIERHERSRRRRLQGTRIYRISGFVLWMFAVSLMEVTVWAAAYLTLNAIEDFEQALYFSMVTFTTLGYGDVLLDEHWRLLASFEAANGIIMFGWTTALVIAAVQRLYFRE